jgi:UDP-N-acetylglucosamine--N-acetylmuramyl-(pentapeptide) pyrophosphoryl-undecaprenol N-acetylglucosamine transferase
VRLMLSGGGTGGHVYPALAVVEELRSGASADGASHLDAVLYVGTVGGMEASIVSREGVDYRAVQAAGLRGLSPWRMTANALSLLRGCAQAWRIIGAFKPDVVLATGGYASAPAVVAAWLHRCPVLIYLPDIVPGLAVRCLSRLAKRIAVSFDASLAYFATGKAVVTGYPVRRALHTVSAQAARQRLGLPAEARVVLVLGGSRGAHTINVAVSEALVQLLEEAHLVHIAGKADIGWLQQRREVLAADLRAHYHLYAYLHEEMVDALLASDLAVARAGAATMGEFAAVGLPSVLVPYPYAGQHQDANADFMVSRGAAVKVLDGQLKQGLLPKTLDRLLADDARRRLMAQNARELARPDASRGIAQQLTLLSGGR